MRTKPPISKFQQYREALDAKDAQSIDDYFSELRRHCALPAKELERFQEDFEAAILSCHASGVPLETALERLSIEHLGGFYLHPPILWYSLDDAAKIYPLSIKHGRMAVFRLSVYLNEPVRPELLQIALTFTIKRFPSFATTVKKGFFWHYLDAAKRRYPIEPETTVPCRPLRIEKSGSPAFRVLYYQKRISVEYFHILTDGTGGMVFLKTLLAEYLRLLGVRSAPGEGILSPQDLPDSAEFRNEFSRAEETEKTSGFVDRVAVQMSGRLSRRKPNRILHFRLDAAKLKEAAGRRNATITAYTLALLFLAGRAATDDLEGEFSIQVPVNMRKFHPSKTVRNFAMYCSIRLPVSAVTDMDSILVVISQQLIQKASEEAMSEMMGSTRRMVNRLRLIPLFIKAPLARMVYGFLGDQIFTNTLSNLGVVTLPTELAAQVDCMDFVLGTALSNRASCAMVTCNNVAMLSITKMTADPSFEEALYRLLCADGVLPAVEGSESNED